MFSKLLTAITLITATGFLSANDFQTDFNSEKIPGMKIIRRASVDEGFLMAENGAEVQFDLKSAIPYKIKIRFCVEEILESKHPPYFAITLHGKDNTEGCFMFREKNIEHFLYKNKKRKYGYGGYSECKIVPGQWLTVELNVMKNFVQISRDGQVIGTGKYSGLIPLEKISFKLYNAVVKIDDLSLEQQKETVIEAEKNPKAI